MFNPTSAFSGFSVDDLDAAKEFYAGTLGLAVEDTGMGLRLSLPGGSSVFLYQKDGHQAATFTLLNFEVEDIDAAVRELASRGVSFERYPGMPQDENGVMRGKSQGRGPDIAWFTDPAGNILSVLAD